MNRSLIAAAIAGITGLSSPGFAQDTNHSARGTEAVPERIVVTREIPVSARAVEPARPAIAPVDPAILSGGVGGAIGGYYINGATRADNLPLPGGTTPDR
jgi:hypothetical protein